MYLTSAVVHVACQRVPWITTIGLDVTRSLFSGAWHRRRKVKARAMTTKPLVSAANTAVDQRERDAHCGIFGVRPTSQAFVGSRIDHVPFSRLDQFCWIASALCLCFGSPSGAF